MFLTPILQNDIIISPLHGNGWLIMVHKIQTISRKPIADDNPKIKNWNGLINGSQFADDNAKTDLRITMTNTNTSRHKNVESKTTAY